MAKKKTNDEKIVAAIDMVDKAIRDLQKFEAGDDMYIDEATAEVAIPDRKRNSRLDPNT